MSRRAKPLSNAAEFGGPGTDNDNNEQGELDDSEEQKGEPETDAPVPAGQDPNAQTRKEETIEQLKHVRSKQQHDEHIPAGQDPDALSRRQETLVQLQHRTDSESDHIPAGQDPNALSRREETLVQREHDRMNRVNGPERVFGEPADLTAEKEPELFQTRDTDLPSGEEFLAMNAGRRKEFGKQLGERMDGENGPRTRAAVAQLEKQALEADAAKAPKPEKQQTEITIVLKEGQQPRVETKIVDDSELKPYTARWSVMHQGRAYHNGMTVKLNTRQAKKLLGQGAIAEQTT